VTHVICFSGGKDSTALVLWALEHLGEPGREFITVFCDTGWEHPITYAYIEEINRTVLNGTLIAIKNPKFFPTRPAPLKARASARDRWRFAFVMERFAELMARAGFVQLSIWKHRVASPKARFCTEHLKVKPMIEFLKGIDDHITVYQGIRADESASRAAMLPRQWSDDYDAWIERPLLHWPAARCFETMAEHGVKPNPLYLMGCGRVGCFPCVMINHRELKALLTGETGPELRRRLFELERITGRSFFEPTYIPARYCSGRHVTNRCTCGHDLHAGHECGVNTGTEQEPNPCSCSVSEAAVVPFPWVSDVFRYLERRSIHQLPLLQPTKCMSIYNLCE
jgi:3'-phosphoadenosine 5'-phosphosulfate sulfotransferase (PAPS reductase)/FAD synthetase